MGALYGEKGDFDNALKYLKKALEINELYPSTEVASAHYNLGVTYLRLSKYKEAEEAFNKVMMSDDESLKKEAQANLTYIRGEIR